MTIAEQFLADIDAFLMRSGMTATTFGLQAVKDPNLIGDLRKGRMPSLRLVEKVRAFMRSHDEASAA